MVYNTGSLGMKVKFRLLLVHTSGDTWPSCNVVVIEDRSIINNIHLILFISKGPNLFIPGLRQ